MFDRGGNDTWSDGRLGSPDLAEAADAPSSAVEDGEGLWAVIRDRLAGRWRSALVVGALLAAVAGPLGYLATTPRYESRGLVRIAPKLDHVLHETQETELIPFYSQFVLSQAQVISSERVLQEALQDDSMREVDWTTEPGAVDRLAANLEVDAHRNSQFITVAYNSDSAKEAEIAVNAVLRAYSEISSMSGGSSVAMKLEMLQKRRSMLNLALHEKKKQLQELPSVQSYGTTDLNELMGVKVEQLERYNSELEQLRIALAITSGEGEDDRAPLAALSDAQLDAVDPDLARLRQQRDALRMAFEQVARKAGHKSRAYRLAEQDLAAAEELLKERENAARERLRSSGGAWSDGAGAGVVLSREQLLAKQEAITTIRDKLEEEIERIGRDRVRAEDFNVEIAQIQRDMNEVESRIVDLQVESESADRARISVFQWGVRPAEPAKDRRAVFACMGVFGGFSASFFLFFVVGSIDRRAYEAEQLSDHGELRCLGVLPDLGRSVADPESAETAAHCVHQIRNIIEASRNASEPTALLVSSPFQGDGKTSITLALGFSYAKAGYRTIVVDGDLVGRGLTRQLGLVGAVGLKEVLRADAADGGEIVDLDQPANLWALPVGVDSQVASHSIRKGDVSALVTRLKQDYDVVLIDTGPVLGSLECIPLASAVDGVILTVRRGRRRTRLDDCLKYLGGIGARCLGVVFNCAPRSDCDRYVSETSMEPTAGELALANVHASRQSSPSSALVSAMRDPESTRHAA